MSNTLFFQRFLTRRKRKQLSLAIFSHQVLCVNTHGDVVVEEILAGDTIEAVSRLFEKIEIQKADVSLLLGRNQYQSILIDDPELPPEDMFSALPFKLKDYLSESPLDVVADGFDSPLSGRFQAMAANKASILQISTMLMRRQCRLKQVTVEDAQLAAWTDTDSTEMVLNSLYTGGIQLTVISKGKLCFQRQIRTLALDNSHQLSETDIDELALEIQRSLDYLRSQLRQTQIRGVILDLDSLDDKALALSLSARLTVKVRTPEFRKGVPFREKLAFSLLETPESLINLYRDSLGHKTPWLTFEKMLGAWGITMLLLSSVYAYEQWQLSDASKNLLAKNGQLEQLRVASQDLSSRLSLHLPSEEKKRQLNALKQQMADSQRTLSAVADHDKASLEGFAGVLRDLSSASRADISIEEVNISPYQLNIKGLAASPDAVPAWVTTFKRHRYLASKAFASMEINQREDKLLEFTLKTQRDSDEVASE
ncbi:MSHA biogenesis protein MshI [Veronia nyctiphanis]|uniref:MSHA biogenesis protein MshI n=1 Tax=Veronia nyctiphanis TaxID=1278244 RepID=A0A4Q0YM84_9GAMM|nr:PilN domain-containing protein [Veronia nyctiphanis]RXJ71952.1 MSHA biogenesis protein MshI [Veronia nyctiphanis]